MNFTGLLLRNLAWHWRANLAVLLGVVVGAAALTGALVVGDSLRGSLRAMALEQLGWIDDALVAGRFFREGLANSLPAGKISPAIMLQCSATVGTQNAPHVNKVTLLAVDDRFWPADAMPVDASFWRGSQDSVVLNRALADKLGVKVGDKVNLFLQNADNVPRETLIGRRKSDDVLSELDVTVRQILPDFGMGRFTLRPSPAAPLNAFVPLGLLQNKYDPDKDKYPLKGRVNALFAAGPTAQLQAAVHKGLTLNDWNLVLRTPQQRAGDLFSLLAAGEDRRPDWRGMLRKYRWNGRIPDELARQANSAGELTQAQFVEFFEKNHGYTSLESSQVFIEAAVETAAEESAAKLGWKAAPTFAYMVDTLSDGKNQAPYVIVAALDPRLPPPLGPIQPANLPPLADGEILLAQWPGCPLQPAQGQEMTLSYDVPDSAGKLIRREEKMKFAGWIPLQGAADDPDLTPRFEGITDRLTIRDWVDNLPFTMDKRRLTRADHEYWERYRATPKAYVTLSTGQRLWASRFGDATSIRLAAPSNESAARFESELLARLQPVAGGFLFDNVKERALAAGAGSNDFGMLFLSFSCFLIVAALLLVGLMFRLTLDQRASEMGLLLAVGWRRSTVRMLALVEGTFIAAFGALVGVGVAVEYAGLLLEYLGVLWPGGLDRSFLRLHVTWQSFAIGYAASLVISVLTIWWTTRVLVKMPPRALLAGGIVTVPHESSRLRLSLQIAFASILAAFGCMILGAFSQDHEAKAGSFFGSGLFALTAFLAALWWWMRRTTGTAASFTSGSTNTFRSRSRAIALARLALRNAARHPVRSLLTVGLLASAAFMVVGVQAFHRDAGHDFLSRSGGSGGYAWIAESTVPIYQDFSSAVRGRALDLPPDIDSRVVPLRLQAGDDASCLNLYQPRQPRILGVPKKLIEDGGFRFAESEGNVKNPWQLLLKQQGDGAIPAIGEANTVTWMLKSGLGQEVAIRDGRGHEARLRIVGLLQDSVFQGELLIGEENFLRLFPRQEGFQFFLIDVRPGERGNAVRRVLETALANYGFTMTPAQERLQSYLDVENTYLATFQALGGLGLLLGTLGLAVVLVRSVWERRGELALLRALGFRRSALGWLVLAENVWLLVLGMAAGCAAALIAIAPFIATQSQDILQPRLFALLGLVVIVGLGAGALAMYLTLRTPLLPALRRE
jgi:putative ABC transport system permease protein